MLDFLSIFSDGGARGNPGPAACAVVFVKSGRELFKDSKFLGMTTNNVAEYEGVLFALKTLLNNPTWHDGRPVNFFLDSELIVNQLKGSYKIKNSKLAALSLEAKKIEREIPAKIFYEHIARSRNYKADKLLNEELDRRQ